MKEASYRYALWVGMSLRPTGVEIGDLAVPNRHIFDFFGNVH
jgi:hypothetical protein